MPESAFSWSRAHQKSCAAVANAGRLQAQMVPPLKKDNMLPPPSLPQHVNDTSDVSYLLNLRRRHLRWAGVRIAAASSNAWNPIKWQTPDKLSWKPCTGGRLLDRWIRACGAAGMPEQRPCGGNSQPPEHAPSRLRQLAHAHAVNNPREPPLWILTPMYMLCYVYSQHPPCRDSMLAGRAAACSCQAWQRLVWVGA